MKEVEIIAVLFTLLSVLLLRYRNLWGWLMGILAAIFYLILFKDAGLHIQVIIQVIYILQGIYGWWYWKRHSTNEIIQPIRGNFTTIFHISLIITLGCMIVFLDGISHVVPGDMITFKKVAINTLDFYAGIMAIYATLLLSYRILFSWLIWVITDAVLILLFTIEGLWWSVGLYMLLMFIAFKTYLDWKKSLNTLRIIR